MRRTRILRRLRAFGRGSSFSTGHHLVVASSPKGMRAFRWPRPAGGWTGLPWNGIMPPCEDEARYGTGRQGVSQEESFEGVLAATEEQAGATLRAAAAVTRELRKARVAAAGGQTRELRRALRAGFDFDEGEHLASGAYAKELLATAAARGVDMFEEDERLLCYPSLVRVLPDQAALEIDRRRERRLRPSVVVDLLGAAQGRGPRFRPEPFLDSLRGAYELVVARQGKKADAVVRLIDVWTVLTLLPGQSREYTKPEFARDLYLLDQSGVTATSRSGRR